MTPCPICKYMHVKWEKEYHKIKDLYLVDTDYLLKSSVSVRKGYLPYVLANWSVRWFLERETFRKEDRARVMDLYQYGVRGEKHVCVLDGMPDIVARSVHKCGVCQKKLSHDDQFCVCLLVSIRVVCEYYKADMINVVNIKANLSKVIKRCQFKRIFFEEWFWDKLLPRYIVESFLVYGDLGDFGGKIQIKDIVPVCEEYPMWDVLGLLPMEDPQMQFFPRIKLDMVNITRRGEILFCDDHKSRKDYWRSPDFGVMCFAQYWSWVVESQDIWWFNTTYGYQENYHRTIPIDPCKELKFLWPVDQGIGGHLCGTCGEDVEQSDDPWDEEGNFYGFCPEHHRRKFLSQRKRETRSVELAQIEVIQCVDSASTILSTPSFWSKCEIL